MSTGVNVRLGGESTGRSDGRRERVSRIASAYTYNRAATADDVGEGPNGGLAFDRLVGAGGGERHMQRQHAAAVELPVPGQAAVGHEVIDEVAPELTTKSAGSVIGASLATCGVLKA